MKKMAKVPKYAVNRRGWTGKGGPFEVTDVEHRIGRWHLG